MKHIIIFILLIFTIACKNKDSKSHNRVINNATNDKNKEIKSITIDNSILYYFEDNNISQQINIIFHKEKLSFKLRSINKDNNLSDSLEGEAILNNLTEMEFEEDNDGNAIPVNEYIYKFKECWISFRVENEHQRFIKLKQTDCKIFETTNNLYSEFILKKK